MRVTLTPEQATKDAMNRAMNRAMASPEVMALARALQRAAFADRPDRAASMTGEFRVAPVYLSQAMAIATNRGVLMEVCVTLNTVVG